MYQSRYNSQVARITHMSLSHINEKGEANMVDVSAREETKRTAECSALVIVSPEVMASIVEGSVPKGDVFSVARIAGILAAKKTYELIPLCHPIALHKIQIDLKVTPGGIEIKALVITADRTGVEMEALVAVTIAGLTIIDMVKSMDPQAELTNIKVNVKSGGRSGDWKRL